MNTASAITCLSALAHESRLAIFRLLVARGAVPAGELAEILGMPASTLSFHLNDLRAARLIDNQREGRNIFYTANVSVLSELLGHLVEDCCSGHPELCLSDVLEPPKPTNLAPCCVSANREPDHG